MVRITYKVHDIVIPQANDPTKTVSKTVYEAEDHHAESGMIGFAGPDIIISSGVAIITDTLSIIRGEGAAADTLDFITFGATPEINDKDLVWLESGAEDITLAHNAISPPANSGPILLLSQINKKMSNDRMVLLQRQGANFQEIAHDGIVGNGGILVTDDENNAIIVCGSVPSAVNHLKITNAATGNDVVIESIGTDSDIGLEIKGKGTKFVQILSLIVTTLYDVNSLAWGKVNSIASAVNELTFSNAATGTDPILEGTGTDADVGIEIKTKGIGVITAINTKITNIRESVGGALAIVIAGAASIVNHFEFKPSITTVDLEINALGTDTDIGIKLSPKGAGEIIGAMETMMIPLGDESTVNTVGVKYTFDVPNNISIVSVYQSTTIAPTTAALTLDILDETVSIFSTKPTIAAGANNGEDGVLNSTPYTLVKGDKLEFSVVTVDTGVTSAGTKLFVRFYRTA